MPPAKRSSSGRSSSSSSSRSGATGTSASSRSTGAKATKAAARSGAKSTGTSARKGAAKTATQAKSGATKTRTRGAWRRQDRLRGQVDGPVRGHHGQDGGSRCRRDHARGARRREGHRHRGVRWRQEHQDESEGRVDPDA